MGGIQESSNYKLIRFGKVDYNGFWFHFPSNKPLLQID